MTEWKDFEVVCELREGPGNITITPEGRIIISQHQFYKPTLRVVEVLGRDEYALTRAFPNDSWSRDLRPNGIGLGWVLGLRSDPEGNVWLLDNMLDDEKSPLEIKTSPRIVAWDTRVDALHRVIHLPPPVTIPGSFLNDLAVDPKHGAIYIADIAAKHEDAALVVVDLRTGFARRLLQQHVSTAAEDISMKVDEQTVSQRGGEALRVGVNPITIDVEYAWLYYGAMHGTKLYRVRTRHLLDATLSPEELEACVETFSDKKPPSDGISMDAAGNVYVTDTQQSGIGVIKPDGSYQLRFSDKKYLCWPDSIVAGPDGFMYVTVNKLHLTGELNAGKDESRPPYYIVRFPPIGAAVVGR